MPSEHCLNRSFPTAVEPVKEIPATFGLVQRSSPISAACERCEVMTLITPAGNPASSANLASASAVSGVSSAGLITTVQPKNHFLIILKI